MGSKLLDQTGNWVLLMPVRDLLLSEAVNYEYRVNRVTFVRASNLAQRRRRFGFPVRLSTLKQQVGYPLRRIIDEHDTIAVARGSGSGEEVVADLVERAKDELAILSFSQLSYSRRRANSRPEIAERVVGADRQSGLVVNCETGDSQVSSKIRGKFGPLALNRRWSRYQDRVFFKRLLKILRGDETVAPRWRRTLWDVAVLGGQSQGSTEKVESFLWNMIALEALLAEHDDKKGDVLPSRIKAFIGWAQDWEIGGYESRIDNAYKKRSALVHQGKRGIIEIPDILFTDDLLVNVVMNIVRHPALFGSKRAIVEFSRKVEAERVLGIRPSVQPKTLKMIKPRYVSEDFERL